MPRSKKDALPDIDINGDTFKVKGYGRYDGNSLPAYFVYDDYHIIDLPVHEFLKKGRCVVKIDIEDGVFDKREVSPVQKWTFFLDGNDVPETFSSEWTYTKQPIDLNRILYALHGNPLPPGPVHKKSKNQVAYKKNMGNL